MSFQEVESTALDIDYGLDKIKVIHPVLLYESKIHNLLYLDQSDRNDKEHVIVMDHAVSCYLQELMEKPNENDANLLYGFQKLVSLGQSYLGELIAEDGISPLRHLDLVTCFDNFGPKMSNFKQTVTQARA